MTGVTASITIDDSPTDDGASPTGLTGRPPRHRAVGDDARPASP